MTAICEDCGRSFEAREDWMVRCLDCWRRRKREREQRENTTWQQEHQRRAERDPIEGYVRQAHRLVQDAYLAGKRAAEVEEFEQAERRGYDRGYEAARAEFAAISVDPVVLKAAITLTHPDRHPAERFDTANRVTQQLLALLNTKTARRGRRAA